MRGQGGSEQRPRLRAELAVLRGGDHERTGMCPGEPLRPEERVPRTALQRRSLLQTGEVEDGADRSRRFGGARKQRGGVRAGSARERRRTELRRCRHRLGRCRGIREHDGMPTASESPRDHVRDAESIARDEQSAGQGIFGRRDASKRRRNGHGYEAKELGARLRQRAERGGKHRRGGRRARTRQRGGHVIDHVLDGRLRAEERPRQTADARPGLLDVAVELDGHQGVESDLAGERLRSLQGFDGERADPGDEAEDLAGDLGGVTLRCLRGR